jgi:CheY-like chemotaxis protein
VDFRLSSRETRVPTRAKQATGWDNRIVARVKPLVLLVEDQLELRQMYVQQLELGGFDVIEAENGADAVTNTAAHVPDVVLMDLSLPVLDGWEATRRLKADARTAHIPVVALTAHDGSGELERATNAGCDWFVPKPCPPDALITEIRRVLAR